MKRIIIVACVAFCVGRATPADAQDAGQIVVSRADARPHRPALAANFTGTARVQALFGTPALFDVERDVVTPTRLTLENVRQLGDGIPWCRYRIDRQGR